MKKLMIAVTGLAMVATLGAAVPVTGITANAATKKTTATKNVAPSLKVNAIYNNTTQITGTATKGAKITVKSTANAKKNLGTATASKTTGKYTVKLAKTLKAQSNVYVYATNPTTKAYFYRVIRVQTAKTTASSTKKTTKSFKVNAPAGTWKSNTTNKYSQILTFSAKNGFNQTLYKNGKQVKKLVSYASYSMTAKTPTFWKVSYKSGSTTKTLYLRYTPTNKFTVVNAKNQIVKVKVGNAPAAVWTFTKK
ncbi:Ig-like domain-containing protein [Lactiplantibacillus plantarum]|uniref:Ig-like domain-containing protein n=1 Tax=Lactiplantibacillus plantarum TaxID=1590 RepID=UPI001D06DAA4|nr:Ig-like domain-containing protein [Lactiplantibacillus plantarum]MCB7152078.1 Ig-like domain-containing protein [Lactiplantibacillus plantarum]MCB7171994.1 Ig-like domain-containing protein [Lactiplantibacillus plantarum]